MNGALESLTVHAPSHGHKLKVFTTALQACHDLALCSGYIACKPWQRLSACVACRCSQGAREADGFGFDLRQGSYSYFLTAQLHGKVIWITGASTGIGKALAFDAAKLGARIIISARSEQLLHDVKAKCLGENISGFIRIFTHFSQGTSDLKPILYPTSDATFQ